MVNYQLGKIYKIVDNTNGNIYIGSTCTQYLSSRLVGHKSNFKNYSIGKFHYITSFEILKNEDYDIVLLEECKCDNKMQLYARERHYIDQLDCVNKQKPTQTKQEYNQQYQLDHNEEIKEKSKLYRDKEENKEKSKQYHINHKDELNAKSKQYHNNHKDELNAKSKQYQIDHKNEIQEKKKQYHINHKDEFNAKSKQYYDTNKEHYKQYFALNKDKINARRRELAKLKKEQINIIN